MLANILVFLRLLQQETWTSGLADSKFAARQTIEMQWYRLLKLPMLLEGEALVVWLKLSEDDKKTMLEQRNPSRINYY